MGMHSKLPNTSAVWGIDKIMRIFTSSWFQLGIGILIFGAGLVEVIDTLDAFLNEFRVHAGHGVVLAGFSQVIKSTSELIGRE